MTIKRKGGIMNVAKMIDTDIVSRFLTGECGALSKGTSETLRLCFWSRLDKSRIVSNKVENKSI